MSRSRRHHNLVDKESQENTKQEQGKYYLSEEKVQLERKHSWKKTSIHSKQKEALLEN